MVYGAILGLMRLNFLSVYCAFVVGPKVEKFRKTFAARVKA